MTILIYILAFLIAIGPLVVLHELGHYSVARWFDVKIQRFSIGFGKVLFMRRFGRDQTEWAIAAIPLGGYVKMLDENEGAVPENEKHRAFNRKNVWQRFAIVSAGPLANFAVAIFVYWTLFIHGVEEIKPVIDVPPIGTPAAAAQLERGDMIRKINDQPIRTWQELQFQLLQYALEKQKIALEVLTPNKTTIIKNLDLSQFSGADIDSNFMNKAGFKFYQFELPATIGMVFLGDPADRAGLKTGDTIIRINEKEIKNWNEMVSLIASSPGESIKLRFIRDGVEQEVQITPQAKTEKGRTVGRIGIGRPNSNEFKELVIDIQYGFFESLGKAIQQTWDMTKFILKTLYEMIFGSISWKNLSGPLTIAEYAGQSAQLGISFFLRFIAVISISLGVMNFLPIPLLDGGHLMYYLIEIIKGRPVSERAMEIGQRIGMGLLLALMVYALYNDIVRIFAG